MIEGASDDPLTKTTLNNGDKTMTQHTYTINVSNYGTTHTATYTNKEAALKAAKALTKDWSSYADTGYSVYMDGSDTPIHEGSYKDGKAMLGY